jgi:outer membrane protein assembly factor BamB
LQTKTFISIRRLSLYVLVVLCISLVFSTVFFKDNSYAAQHSNTLIPWLAFNGGGSRSGVNNAETTITRSNVKNLKEVWQQTLPAVADNGVVELPNVNTPGGTRTLLFATTTAGSLLAIDASNGTIVWRKDTSGPHFTTSEPAIDPAGTFVYSYGLDGKVHKYAVGTGNEVVDNTWPVMITNRPQIEKGNPPLDIANGYLYMATSGFGDWNHYEGHLVAVNLSTGATSVWNSECSNLHHLLAETDCPDVEGAIWGRGAPVLDPLTGNILVATGNGPFRGDGRSYGDSVIELTPDLSKVVDSYTPSNYAELDAKDQDLGSTDPVILPKQEGSNTPYLMVQGGKDNNLRLINRQNLSGQGGPNHTGGEIQTLGISLQGDINNQPAVWTDSNGTTWVFVTNFGGLMAYKVVTVGGNTSLQLAYQSTGFATSPFIANGILFIQGASQLQALDPTSGQVLWSTTSNGAHWQSPLVVNGNVYVLDNNGHLTDYALQ